MDLLRFITAGSVDDGKSTLIGRLLYDSKSILADQLEALHASNRKNDDGTIDLATGEETGTLTLPPATVMVGNRCPFTVKSTAVSCARWQKPSRSFGSGSSPDPSAFHAPHGGPPLEKSRAASLGSHVAGSPLA